MVCLALCVVGECGGFMVSGLPYEQPLHLLHFEPGHLVIAEFSLIIFFNHLHYTVQCLLELPRFALHCSLPHVSLLL